MPELCWSWQDSFLEDISCLAASVLIFSSPPDLFSPRTHLWAMDPSCFLLPRLQFVQGLCKLSDHFLSRPVLSLCSRAGARVSASCVPAPPALAPPWWLRVSARCPQQHSGPSPTSSFSPLAWHLSPSVTVWLSSSPNLRSTTARVTCRFLRALPRSHPFLLTLLPCLS